MPSGLRESLIQIAGIRAKVVLHIPFEVAVKRFRIEVIEKLHADQSLLIVALEFEVTVDFAVVRLDEFTLFKSKKSSEHY